ncbi:Diphthine methyltransferase [Bulinus truncatus]|nr:Diphthine methyltransferase [Bulinus truncatus]
MNVQKIDTHLNADSVEFCPYDGLQQILICGTYKLDENNSTDMSSSNEQTEEVKTENSSSKQVRNGGFLIFKLVFDEASGPSLHKCQNVNMCGVLDIKWPQTLIQDDAVFGLVDAEGFVQILRLHPDNFSVETLAKCELSKSSLGLSLGWTGLNCRGDMLSASDSLGYVTVFNVNKEISQVSAWKAHDYEAWITAFDNFNPNVVYSGGDDAKLKVWDIRDLSKHTFCINRHKMGVCSIQSHPFTEHIVATGSYDENLFIWDDRNFTKPLNCVALGGGIWRIKWDPFFGNSILTATMYNGAHIVNCREMDKELSVSVSYQDHNLTYGADWCRLKTEESSDSLKIKAEEKCFFVSTCSFYDHSLHLWKWNTY